MIRIALTGVVCVALAACTGPTNDELSAEDELLLTAISGEEEDFARGASSLTPDAAVVGQPALFRTCGVGQLHQALLAQYDADGDGELSADERATLWSERTPRERIHLARRALRWNRIQWVYDADEDGVLSVDERANLQDDFTARCELKHTELVDLYDIDEDGVLGPAERVLVRADRLENALERRDAFLDTWDTDGSGQIEPAEAQAIRAAFPDLREDYRQAQLALFDADGSGHLDATERATQRAQQREWIATGFDLRGE